MGSSNSLTFDLLNNILPLLKSQDKDLKTMGEIMLLDVNIHDKTTTDLLKACCIRQVPQGIKNKIMKKIYNKTIPVVYILSELQGSASNQLQNFIIRNR